MYQNVLHFLIIAMENINASSKETELKLIPVTVLWFTDAVLDITAFILESILFIQSRHWQHNMQHNIR